MNYLTDSVEIFPKIYWVGSGKTFDGLQCNPYLICDSESEAVLIEPGSRLDFDIVYKKVTDLVPVESIKYVILSHQDPDLCSAVPLFEEKGLRAEIVTYWRSSVIQRFYGFKAPFYMVNEHDFLLTLRSGRVFRFIFAPYLHFPGAIMTYDETSEILFSGDIFGSFSHNWDLFAGEDYSESMCLFHEHYMPANDVLRPVMESILSLKISTIAPQHGSIIREHPEQYIKALRDLECGVFLNPVKKQLNSKPGYSGLCNMILVRLAAVFDESEIRDIFRDSHIVLSPDALEILDFNSTGLNLWNDFFDRIVLKQSISWLTVLEPLVGRLVKEYDVPFPTVFQTTMYDIKKQVETLTEEKKKLYDLSQRLEKNLNEAQNQLTRCPITQLHNQHMFDHYLKQELINIQPDAAMALWLIRIDDFNQLSIELGQQTTDELLRSVSTFLKDRIETHWVLFKIEGPEFVLYATGMSQKDQQSYLDKIRHELSQFEGFVTEITISVGGVNFSEVTLEEAGAESFIQELMDLSRQRLRFALGQGGNQISVSSQNTDTLNSRGTVLLVDSDNFYLSTLETHLQRLKLRVIRADDGETALRLIDQQSPDLVISEVMIPKIDGFTLREKMLTDSKQKQIPFLLISNNKNESLIERASELKIVHYIKKPFLMSELIGLVKNSLGQVLNEF